MRQDRRLTYSMASSNKTTFFTWWITRYAWLKANGTYPANGRQTNEEADEDAADENTADENAADENTINIPCKIVNNVYLFDSINLQVLVTVSVYLW
jgi:hypothetical protein